MKIWTAFVMTKRKPTMPEQVEDFVPDYDYVVELLKQREKKDDGIQ
jgi:hypothetical protein